MAQEKPGQHAPSFTRLLRGGPAPSPETKDASGAKLALSRDPAKPGEEKKRKPILLPFGKGEGESALFSIGYREWAFLFGASLMLFGGMAVIRHFAPKEGPVTPAFEVPPSDFEEGARAPGGGEPTDELVTSALKARDTTRLVQPLAELVAKDKKDKDKGPKEEMKESFWSGLKEAEKQTGKAPRLPGMMGALDAALGGMRGGSGGVPPMQIRSPEEIAARVGALRAGASRGAPGMRLGYSGGQNIPGIGGGRGRRSKYDSGDGSRKQAGREALGNLYGQPERSAADLAKKFGESTSEGQSNQGPGAVTGGGTPGQDKGNESQVNYKIGRDPVADQIAIKNFEWELEQKKKFWEKVWPGPLYDGISTVIGKGIAEPMAEIVGNSLRGLAMESPQAKQFVYSQNPDGSVSSLATSKFLAPLVGDLSEAEVGSAFITNATYSTKKVTDEGCRPTITFEYTTKEVTESKEKSATSKRASRTFSPPIPCTQIVGYGNTSGDMPAAAGGSQPGAGEPGAPDQTSEPSDAADVKNITARLLKIPELRGKVSESLVAQKAPTIEKMFELEAAVDDYEEFSSCNTEPEGEARDACWAVMKPNVGVAFETIKSILGIK